MGATLRIVKSGTYTDALKVVTNAPKVKVIKYKLQGSLYDSPIIPEVFNSLNEAEDKKNSIEQTTHYSEYVKLEIVEVTELVEDIKL